MNDSLRIFHLISELDGYGGARTLRALAARQARAGRRVTVAALDAERTIVDELRAEGVKVLSIGGRWTMDPIALVRLRQMRRDCAADVVHAWDPVAVAYARLSGRREPTLAAWTGEQPAPTWLPACCVPSHAVLPPCAPPAPAVRRDRQRFLDEFQLPEDARVIALAGRLDRSKQIDEAIWCFELVRVLYPTARLVVFGDGLDRHRLERYAELVSEAGCVRFPGYRRDLLELLPCVDVFWQLGRSSSTPYALLEAMAAGVPIVASDLPAHRSAVTPNVSGLLTPARSRADVARATDQLLSDAALARRMGEAASVAAQQQWSIDNCAAACEPLYHSLKSLNHGP